MPKQDLDITREEKSQVNLISEHIFQKKRKTYKAIYFIKTLWQDRAYPAMYTEFNLEKKIITKIY